MTDPAHTTQAGYRAHYDASQFRAATWMRLKNETARLERASSSGDQALREARAEVGRTLETLAYVERYWAFPGRRACTLLQRKLDRGRVRSLARLAARYVRLLVSDAYRSRDVSDILREESEEHDGGHESDEGHDPIHNHEVRPYFEVLIVDDLNPEEASELRRGLLAARRESDEFVYDTVVVPSLQGGIIAAMFNHNIQTCVLRYDFPYETNNPIPEIRQYMALLDDGPLREAWEIDPSAALADALTTLRPELDLFLVTDDSVREVTGAGGENFRRVFFHQEDTLELHLSILKGIRERYETPFFTALKDYSHKPTGVFHALPISRGKSISKSHWIQDMGEFYGPNIFLAETSATTGGLDSLLQPTGPLKLAQEAAARAFGARKTFFVTNGTSSANKIVMQALVRPGDIVLVSHDCHKSHHYSLMLSGAFPAYIDAYPLTEYSMFGAVSLVDVKRQLLALKRAGKLDRVRMLLLTNCTFDGVVYKPDRVMREVLAIKPDMIFVWDEAWFAFACTTPTYRGRTAMEAARKLQAEFRSDEYAAVYAEWKAGFDELDPDDDDTWLAPGLMPDPELARVRVYATQSTHKTLTSLRQGSMIHVRDQDFATEARDAFHEAYMTYTSTSPNYQILASLDVGRRQVELEGYELVKKSVNLAMALRERIEEHPVLRRYFRVLKVRDMIPEEFRPSGLEEFYGKDSGYSQLERAWREDEFTLDPTRVTLYVGKTGMDGDTMRTLLIDKYDIQINKTSRNTLLFMLNIGTSRGSIAYLLNVLTSIAHDLDEQTDDENSMDRTMGRERVSALTEHAPPLPRFSRFHAAFRPYVTEDDEQTPEGDLRSAYYLAYDESCCDYVPVDTLLETLAAGAELVSANFVIPYPPGFPILVPGQVVTKEIVAYLRALDVKEIHGLREEYGLRVFTPDALKRVAARPRTTAPLPAGADR